MAREIPLSHCVDVIEHFLSRHAGSAKGGQRPWRPYKLPIRPQNVARSTSQIADIGSPLGERAGGDSMNGTQNGSVAIAAASVLLFFCFLTLILVTNI